MSKETILGKVFTTSDGWEISTEMFMDLLYSGDADAKDQKHMYEYVEHLRDTLARVEAVANKKAIDGPGITPKLFQDGWMRGFNDCCGAVLKALKGEQMGYITNGLSFNTLRDANTERLKSSKYKKCEEEWTPAHWMQATLGELGELANILKKVDRGDFTLQEALPEIAKEFADVQTYLDIMAFKLGVDLGQATIDKFNEVSKHIGSRIYIGQDDDWHLWPED